MRWLAVAVILGLSGAGCAPPEKPTVPAPALHPVSGKVLSDGRPLAGGVVEFRLEKQTAQGFTSLGKIEKDGSFTLQTMVNEAQVPGAQAGSHLVIVFPPMGDQVNPAEGHIEPIVLPNLYTVKEGQENKFTLTVPSVRPGSQ